MGKTIILKGIDAFDKALEDVKRRQLKAAINTVNIIAAISRQNAQRLIRKNFTLRNNFTENSVIYSKCPPGVSRLKDVKSEMGLLPKAGYMARQETGGTKTSDTGKNLIIPNTNARLGSNSNRVKKFYQYSNIRTNFKPRVVNGRGSRSKMALAVAAYNAAKSKGFIRINGTIFQVLRFKPKGDNRMFTAKPILNMKHKSVFVPARPWMQPAIDFANNLMQDIFNQEMDKL